MMYLVAVVTKVFGCFASFSSLTARSLLWSSQRTFNSSEERVIGSVRVGLQFESKTSLGVSPSIVNSLHFS